MNAVARPKVHQGTHVENKNDSGFRKATAEELAASRRLFQELTEARAKLDRAKRRVEALEKTCKHVVFYDEGTLMFDYRYCSACGKPLREF